MAVESSRLDLQLSFPILDNRACVGAVTDIDEGNAAGLLLRAGEVKFGDAVTQSCCGCVVDETQDLAAGDFSSVDQGTALGVGEPSRYAHDEVCYGKLELSSGDLFDLAQEHSCELCGVEVLLLAEVVDLGADLAVNVDQGRRDELLLDLDIGVSEFATEQALERANGVLEVGDLLCLGSFSEISGFGSESDERPVVEKRSA